MTFLPVFGRHKKRHTNLWHHRSTHSHRSNTHTCTEGRALTLPSVLSLKELEGHGGVGLTPVGLVGEKSKDPPPPLLPPAESWQCMSDSEEMLRTWFSARTAWFSCVRKAPPLLRRKLKELTVSVSQLGAKSSGRQKWFIFQLNVRVFEIDSFQIYRDFTIPREYINNLTIDHQPPRALNAQMK